MAKAPAKKSKAKVAPEDKPLSEREQRFVNYYMITPNGAEAWRKAGGATKCADRVAYEVLRRPHIVKALDKKRAQMAARFEVTQERVLKEIAYLAFSDPRDVYDDEGCLLRPNEWSAEAAAAVAAVEVVTTSAGEGAVEHVSKIKRWDKGQALEKLCKHLGLFAPEKTEITVTEIRRTVVDPKAEK